MPPEQPTPQHALQPTPQATFNQWCKVIATVHALNNKDAYTALATLNDWLNGYDHEYLYDPVTSQYRQPGYTCAPQFTPAQAQQIIDTLNAALELASNDRKRNYLQDALRTVQVSQTTVDHWLTQLPQVPTLEADAALALVKDFNKWLDITQLEHPQATAELTALEQVLVAVTQATSSIAVKLKVLQVLYQYVCEQACVDQWCALIASAFTLSAEDAKTSLLGLFDWFGNRYFTTEQAQQLSSALHSVMKEHEGATPPGTDFEDAYYFAQHVSGIADLKIMSIDQWLELVHVVRTQYDALPDDALFEVSEWVHMNQPTGEQAQQAVAALKQAILEIPAYPVVSSLLNTLEKADSAAASELANTLLAPVTKHLHETAALLHHVLNSAAYELKDWPDEFDSRGVSEVDKSLRFAAHMLAFKGITIPW